jgi:hypothetical protein
MVPTENRREAADLSRRAEKVSKERVADEEITGDFSLIAA